MSSLGWFWLIVAVWCLLAVSFVWFIARAGRRLNGHVSPPASPEDTRALRAIVPPRRTHDDD